MPDTHIGELRIHILVFMASAFGFGSIAIEALTNHQKPHKGSQKMSIRNFETLIFLLENVENH